MNIVRFYLSIGPKALYIARITNIENLEETPYTYTISISFRNVVAVTYILTTIDYYLADLNPAGILKTN